MESKALSSEQGLLGKLHPGEKKLKGKTFYLHNVKKRSTALLIELISLLRGRVESFLHKDVSFVLTGRTDTEAQKDEKCILSGGGTKGSKEETQHPVRPSGSGTGVAKQQSGTSRLLACGSRGKALLEKAMQNNELLQKSCVLSNAQSWGVKILFADDVLLYLKNLTRESLSANHKKPVKSSATKKVPTVRASALRSPYLKIEDASRKYKPLHMQSMTYPELYYSGRFSPFESPPPPRFKKETEQTDSKPREKKDEIHTKPTSLSSYNPSTWRPRKKELNYCECCRLSFSNLEEHLLSEPHRSFVMDPSSYKAVDQLVAEMFPRFDPNPSAKETLSRPFSLLPVHNVRELDLLTDDQIEQAIKSLHRQDSSNNTHISSPVKDPPSNGHVSPLPEVNTTAGENPDLSPAHTLPCLETHCCLFESQPNTTTPVVTAELQARCQTGQEEILPPRSIVPLFHFEPLPPILSREVPRPPHFTDQQCLYSEPPTLSPKKCLRELSGPENEPTVPLIFSVSPKAEREKSEDHVGFSGLVCSQSDLNCRIRSSHRPYSSPVKSAVAPNQKKRCRSSSPEQSQSKRKRTESIRVRRSWSEPRNMVVKPQKDKIINAERCSSYRNDSNHTDFLVSGLRSTDMIGLKQTSTTSTAEVPNCVVTGNHLKTSDPFFKQEKHSCKISNQESDHSPDHSASVCIEAGLIPDMAALSSSSDSDWDCDLLSRFSAISASPLMSAKENCKLDKELLHRPSQWVCNSSYESHLQSSLRQPVADQDTSAFSRTVVQIVQVQH